MKSFKIFIDEMRMGSDFAAGTGHANRVYNIKDAKEMVAEKPFTVKNGSAFSSSPSFTIKIEKGDQIFNLPGGLFVKKKNGNYPKAPSQYRIDDKFGMQVTSNPENIKAIVSNSKKVR